MKKTSTFLITVSVLVIALIWIKFGKSAGRGDVDESISGTNLRLVAKYEPLHIYVYADIASTNRLTDYAVFEGQEPVFMREHSSSNTVVLTHFENALDVLSTERDNNERILNRSVQMYNDLGHPSLHRLYLPMYTYLDKDGDGLFDKLFIWGTNAASSTIFTRSNLTWVPMQYK